MNFDNVKGTAFLLQGDERIPVKVELDSTDNKLVCSFDVEGNSMGQVGSEVILADIKSANGDVKWSSLKIEGLTVWSFNGDGVWILSKNGPHTFELDKDCGWLFEFSGGIPIASPQLELARDIMFSSDGKKSRLCGAGCKDLDVGDEIVALSLACGLPLYKRFEVKGSELTMYFFQSLNPKPGVPIFDYSTSNGYIDNFKKEEGLKKVYSCAKNSLKNEMPNRPAGSKATINTLILLFLHYRDMRNVLDFQAHGLFVFFEAIDHKGTLNFTYLSSKDVYDLSVSDAVANKLLDIRNDIFHGHFTLSEALSRRKSKKTTIQDVSHDNFRPFLVKGLEGVEKAEATFMNFLHSKANQCFLKLINCDLPPAMPYPTN